MTFLLNKKACRLFFFSVTLGLRIEMIERGLHWLKTFMLWEGVLWVGFYLSPPPLFSLFFLLKMGFLYLLDWEQRYLWFLKRGFSLIEDLLCHESWEMEFWSWASSSFVFVFFFLDVLQWVFINLLDWEFDSLISWKGFWHWLKISYPMRNGVLYASHNLLPFVLLLSIRGCWEGQEKDGEKIYIFFLVENGICRDCCT